MVSPSCMLRLGWVLLTIVSFGTGIVLYLLAWFLMPDENGRRSMAPLAILILFFVLPGCCVLSCGFPSALFGIGG